MVRVVFKEAKSSFTSKKQSVDALRCEITDKFVSGFCFVLFAIESKFLKIQNFA